MAKSTNTSSSSSGSSSSSSSSSSSNQGEWSGDKHVWNPNGSVDSYWSDNYYFYNSNPRYP